MAGRAGMLIAGRFLLADPVGEGEVGSLWRARDQVWGWEVSVQKVLLPSGLADEKRAGLVAHAKHEALAASAVLRNRGGIMIHDVVDQDGALWIVMQPIAGVSLAAAIARDGRLPWPQVAQIGAQVAEMMSLAHAHRIVHRGLSPDQVLLSGGRANVVGFGLAGLAEAIRQLAGLEGQVAEVLYLAPEQVEGIDAGPAADMWALGATLYTAVEGVPPFDSATLSATLTQILTRYPRPMGHAGPLQELLATLLAKNPGRRPDAPSVARVLSGYRLGQTPAFGPAPESTASIKSPSPPAHDDRPAEIPWWEKAALPPATPAGNAEPATPGPAVTPTPEPEPTQQSPQPQPASPEPAPSQEQPAYPSTPNQPQQGYQQPPGYQQQGPPSRQPATHQPPPAYGWAGGHATAPAPAPASARRSRRPTIPRKKRTPNSGPPSAPARASAPQAGGHPAQSTDRLSRTVRSLVQQGLLVFNPPEEMRQGITDRIEVGIARSADFREALSEGLRGRGQPRYEEIETSSLMTVELRGDAFQVTSYSTPEQVVAPTARWEFDVRPIRAGQQTLTLCVCLRLTGREFDPMGGGRRSVPVLERSIRIRVSMAYSTRRFVAGNWQWLIATVAGLGGGIAAWIALFH